MLMLVEGTSGQTTELYVNLLLEETSLSGKAILVIEDAVLFAVRKGDFYYFLPNTVNCLFAMFLHRHREKRKVYCNLQCT